MVGAIRSSIAAGALLVSPGAAAFNQVTTEAPPGVVVYHGENQQARKPEETEIAGGLTLDEIMAQIALRESVTLQRTNVDRNFGHAPKRIECAGVHIGFNAVRRIIQPNRYTNWSQAPKSLNGRNSN